MDGQFYRPKLSIQSANYFPIDDGSGRVNLRTIGGSVPFPKKRSGTDPASRQARADRPAWWLFF
jgi:hypothetical protein